MAVFGHPNMATSILSGDLKSAEHNLEKIYSMFEQTTVKMALLLGRSNYF